MKWETIFTTQRVGHNKVSQEPRSGFQQDFDRLVFSSAFRRLQNKTQVFPLPGSTFVHNRLTHSLEVASVGRSLGSIVGKKISEEIADKSSDSYEFYRYELANVIAAGCLAHDIGNPAFGHSGEKAISAYFVDNAGVVFDGKPLQEHFTEKEWADICKFEGNANAFRLLTRTFKGRLQAGVGLTFTTIASILKYPCEATAMDKKFKHRKKYGFFQAEKDVLVNIAEKLGMIREGGDDVCFKRHPFVYLVEAADDICYRIIDLEDAHRLGILPHQLVKDSLFTVISRLGREGADVNRMEEIYNKIGDQNEKISFLRARAINILTQTAAEVFLENKEAILSGNFNDTLLDNIDDRTGAFDELLKLSIEKIYNHESVLEIEIAGYNVMSELLGLFVPAVLAAKPGHKQMKIRKLFPMQYSGFEDTDNAYEKVMNVLDTISGMTDLYATEFYRKLKGIEIPQHR
ncbi:dGTP triphosphohydrolase [Aridibaculum aurantiacum]|uniref:dGTP triphosphohydrolase n=1 Tax=Aridibaculum aurantiacum TaxID=2810307 RepID=UPI001A9599A1|nr:dNTP triphosphohydrolase [Aridibaculum aurantiacum]